MFALFMLVPKVTPVLKIYFLNLKGQICFLVNACFVTWASEAKPSLFKKSFENPPNGSFFL